MITLRSCLAVAWLLFGVAGCTPEPPSGSSEAKPATNAAPASVVVPAEFQKLSGRWERPDGGYVLELKNPDSAGKFEAAYFNPNPIHVAKAVAVRDGGKTKLFVELQDVNYPGCTYSLEYDPEHDHLFGQYFQAAVQQTYDVTFGRLK